MSRASEILLFVILVACSSDGAPSIAIPTHSGAIARLVDARTTAGTDGETASYYRVEVSRGKIDTLRGVLTTDQPTVVGDSEVLGTLADTTAQRQAFFRYRLRNRSLDTIPVPHEFLSELSEIAISADGTRFTWVTFDDNGRGTAEIHRFPTGELLRASPPIEVSPTDGRVGFGRWTSDGDPEIVIWADTTAGRPWVRLRFDHRAGRWITDTLAN